MKSPPEDSLTELKKQGHRVTRVRSAILQVLQEQTTPLTVADLRRAMRRLGLRPNKTTVYRELAFLVEARLVNAVDLGERKKRYESVAMGHHHHLVCLSCHTIQELKMEAHLTEQENKIENKHKFQVLRHSLEFFGLCRNCQ